MRFWLFLGGSGRVWPVKFLSKFCQRGDRKSHPLRGGFLSFFFHVGAGFQGVYDGLEVVDIFLCPSVFGSKGSADSPEGFLESVAGFHSVLLSYTVAGAA